MINIVLEDCHERVYGETGVDQVFVGLFIVRGDNVAVVGQVDPVKDAKIDLSLVRGTALPPLAH